MREITDDDGDHPTPAMVIIPTLTTVIISKFGGVFLLGFVIQGGDFSTENGTDGESIYGLNLEDENFVLK
ncbi:hypothetical protein ACH5RR_022885 [Cinchona calisaya]|uniref:Uncharacterized protein n=1 Tax=Cinchona calisaya TaxID=153742 RepID=A0ABD2Z928_9GENT